MKQFKTVKEVAELLGLSPQAVRSYCRRQDGRLLAELQEVGTRKVKTWFIFGGSLLGGGLPDVDVPPLEPDPPEPPVEPELSEPPVEPEPPVDDSETAWQAAYERMKSRAAEGEAQERQQQARETGEPIITTERLLSVLRDKMPPEMYARNEILIEIWCQIAPPYLTLDVDKLGKWALYGIPPVILANEAMHRQKKMREEAASGEGGNTDPE